MQLTGILGIALALAITGLAIQRSQILNLRDQAAVSVANNRVLEQAIADQNAAIEREAAAARRKREAAAAALANAAKPRQKVLDSARSGTSIEEIDRAFVESLK